MTVHTVLPAAIRLVLGAEYDVGWRTREARYRADNHVLLSIVSRARKGHDETRYGALVDGSATERIYGVRRLVIQVQCETQDQDVESSAYAVAEDLRTGLHRSDVEALLDTEHLGGLQTMDVRVIDYRDPSGRWRSAAVFEMWLNTHTTHTAGDVPMVASVEVTGDVGDRETGPGLVPPE